jgi:hypothetical protein
MSNRNLAKFPVTAEDGTELLVTIDEWSGGWIRSYAECRLYVPRKWFGYRRIFGTTYDDGRGVYEEGNPDFVAIARQAYEDYRAELHDYRVAALEGRAQAKRKSAAIDAFNSWDGRL